MKRRPGEPSEADIEKTVCDILAWDGWIVRKMEQNFSDRKMKTIGERGMPDRLAIRYMIDGRHAIECPATHTVRVNAQVLWLEIKAIGGGLSKAQKTWTEQERRRGALVVVIYSIEQFTTWYKASELQRR